MNREKVQQEALDIAITNKRVGLGISMGVGKTRIGLQHLIRFFNPDINVLVVAPKKTIFKAWIDETEKMECQHLLDHITFTTYLSLKKHDPSDYDIVYLDECHSMLPTHEIFLAMFTGRILGLTGTPPKQAGTDKWFMVNKYCPIKYEFTVDDASDSNILNQYQIIIHQLHLGNDKTLLKKRKDGGHWYTSETKDYDYVTGRVDQANTQKQKQFASIMRMRSIMDYTTKEEYTKQLMSKMDKKCIVFANTQAQADRVCSHSFHSKNKQADNNLELFSDGRVKHLSCVLQLSEGISIPNLTQGVIMHAYGNERKSAQRIGRLLRLSPDQTATCHILCYMNTVDEQWVKRALSSFDNSKIKYYNPLNHQYEIG